MSQGNEDGATAIGSHDDEESNAGVPAMDAEEVSGIIWIAEDNAHQEGSLAESSVTRAISDVIWIRNGGGGSRDSSAERTANSETAGNDTVVVEDSGSEVDAVANERIVVDETRSSDAEMPSFRSPSENADANSDSEEDPPLNANSLIVIERESDIVQEPSVVYVPENANAGVENPIIRLENPDYEPEESADAECSRGSLKRSYGVMMSDDNDGQTCPICLDVWSTPGAHRLSSLKCGHFFGKSCISRWLSLGRNKHCPQCNKKAHARDIRDHYATKLMALDATEKNRLERELAELSEEKKKLELELSRTNMTMENIRQQRDVLKNKIAALEGDTKVKRKGPGQKAENGIVYKISKFHLEKTLDMSEGYCRVAAYSSLSNLMVVSHKMSENSPFRGYGLRKISKIGAELCVSINMFAHTKAVRDLSFHPSIPNLILSASFDKSAKLLNMDGGKQLKMYKTNHPLWSCCWDLDDHNIFYVGAGNGVVFVYSTHAQSEPIALLNPTDDFGAVVALRYKPARAHINGAVICCRLNSIVLYEKVSPTEYHSVPLQELHGPFFSVSYDVETRHLLVSCRPSLQNPKVRHVYCELDGSALNIIFVFHGGNRQTLLCRSCLLSAGGETLVAAFQENTNTIELWSTSTGARFQSISIQEQLVDIISMRAESKNFLATVSDFVVRLFEGPT